MYCLFIVNLFRLLSPESVQTKWVMFGNEKIWLNMFNLLIQNNGQRKKKERVWVWFIRIYFLLLHFAYDFDDLERCRGPPSYYYSTFECYCVKAQIHETVKIIIYSLDFYLFWFWYRPDRHRVDCGILFFLWILLSHLQQLSSMKTPQYDIFIVNTHSWRELLDPLRWNDTNKSNFQNFSRNSKRF